MSYVLVTGGVRSGKSAFAEKKAGAARRVLYVATGAASDAEMEKRIAQHRERRPAQWGLLETADGLADALEAALPGEWEAVLVDCLSTWVGNVLFARPESEWRSDATRAYIREEAGRLAAFLEKSAVPAVVVTSETGLGGVAMSPLGRAFQDLLGEVNQILAAKAGDVYLVVAGRVLRLPGADA